MTLDLQTISLLASIAASIVTTLGVVGGWLWAVNRSTRMKFARLAAEIERIEREGKLAIEAANARAHIAEEELRRSIEGHKLYAAENYATQEGLEKAIEPILRAIERLGDRLDRVLSDPRAARA